MIKAIVFDIGGVLMKDMFPSINKYVADEFGVPEDQFNEVRRKYWLDALRGHVTIEEFFSNIFKDLDLPHERVKDIVQKSYDFLVVDKPTMGIVKDIKAKNEYKLAILSNNITEWARRSEELLQEDKYFDKVICSCDIEFTDKPHPEIYKYLVDQLEINPDEILFIDNQEANVSAAMTEGIRSIFFTSADKLLDDLKELGIL